jgi:hypothetical protein
LDSEDTKLGEGANTSAYFTPRGYVLKPVVYDENAARNPNNSAESPESHVESVKGLERFPWVELEKVESEEVFDHAWVRMSAWDLSHSEAIEAYHFSDVISQDLDLFLDLREEGITYRDFKPGNIGYFWTNNQVEGMPVAKAVDVTDGSRKPWDEEENLSRRDFSGILEVYIRGTADEQGLVDRYPLGVHQAEEYIFEYLGLESEATGDIYEDFFQAFGEFSSQVEDEINR